jgi:hypothetical protein
MESQNKCNDTTEESTLNTSGKGRDVRKFKLIDLHRLTFTLEEGERPIDVETATPEQFNAWTSDVADVADVDTLTWPLEVRRDLINDLWEYCLTEGYAFPLTEVADETATEAG